MEALGMTVVVLHSTEGGSLDGAVATLRARGVPSHEVVDVREQLVVQLVSLDRPAKSLLNLKGGVETNNRGGVIQVELVGYASRSSANGRPGPIMSELTDDELTWLGHYVRQLCAKTGAPFVFPCRFKPYPESYGARNGVRLSFADWLTVEGVIGHQHVPENTHGDPGALDVGRMAALSAPPAPLPMGAQEMRFYRTTDTGNFYAVYYARVDGVLRLVKAHISGPDWAWLGEPGSELRPITQARIDELVDA